MEEIMKIGNATIIFNDQYCVEDPQPILDRIAEIVGYRLEQMKRLPDRSDQEAKG